MGFPSAPVLPGEHAGGTNGCGELHVLPFPGISLLYVLLETSADIQNHLSMSQVAKTPQGVSWTGEEAESDPVPQPSVLASTVGTGLSCHHG